MGSRRSRPEVACWLYWPTVESTAPHPTAFGLERMSHRTHVLGRGLLFLCRYITCPALSDEWVQLNGAGQVNLKLKMQWSGGTTRP